MQSNNVQSLVSFYTLHVDEIEKKTETSMNPIIVNKEPGTVSLFPICTFETLVLYTKIRNKELLPGSRFPVSSFTVLKYSRRLLK